MNPGTDSKVHGANMGPTWVLSTPDGPHVGPLNLAIWGALNIPNNPIPTPSTLLRLSNPPLTYILHLYAENSHYANNNSKYFFFTSRLLISRKKLAWALVAMALT